MAFTPSKVFELFNSATWDGTCPFMIENSDGSMSYVILNLNIEILLREK